MTRTSATSTDALIDADWLELHLTDPDVRVVEVDVSAARHESGHIPGAVLWNVYADLKDDTYRPRPAAELAALVDRSGIEPGSTVVTYGYAPALGYWLLRVLGHHRVRVLDTATWHAEGRPWTSRPSRPAPSGYRPAPVPGLRADPPAVAAMVGDHSGTILDVRSEAEYVGERFWPSGGIPDGGRAGHIQGRSTCPPTCSRRRTAPYDRWASSESCSRTSTASSPWSRTARWARVPRPSGSRSPSCSATRTCACTTARGPSGAWIRHVP